MLNLANILITEVEGPGRRIAIWTQGCLKNCKNCCNPEMIPIRINKVVKVDEINNYILKHKNEIEGITLIGGEPFLQAKNLIKVAKFTKDLGLSVIAFSGYTLKELQTLQIEKAKELLEYLDVLIDGEYDDNNPEDSRKWIGSKNQNIYFFSDRYSYKDFDNKVDEVEFRFCGDKILLNGFPIF